MPLTYDVVNGSGPTMVCLPMFGTTKEFTREALAPALAGAGLREIYVDLPGHGQSAPTAEPSSEAVLESVVAFLIDHTGGATLLSGCSYGGYLAAAVARRHPHLVSGLLLTCPGVSVAKESRDLRDVPLVRPTEPNDDGGDWLSGVAPDLRNHLAAALSRPNKAVAERISALLTAGAGDDGFQERLQTGAYALTDEASDLSFAGPTTIIAGRQDRMVGFADQSRQLRLYPQGTLAVLDRAGHYLPFEQPDPFRALVHDWLARCQ